jgi:hypothetical protein
MVAVPVKANERRVLQKERRCTKIGENKDVGLAKMRNY